MAKNQNKIFTVSDPHELNSNENIEEIGYENALEIIGKKNRFWAKM